MKAKNKLFYFEDSSALAFQPLIDLSSSEYANLSAKASSYWLGLDPTPSQWGAFMFFYGPTRKLLRAGGLNIEVDNFNNLFSLNSKWKAFVHRYKFDLLNHQEIFYFIKLLYYLGFYNQGIDICKNILRKIDKSDETLWALYLLELGTSILKPTEWEPRLLIKKALEIGSNDFSILHFEIFLLISKYFIRYKKDVSNSNFWLNKIQQIQEHNAFDNSILPKARFDKYKGDLLTLRGHAAEAIDLLIGTINELNESISTFSEDCNFLKLETKRRLLDAIIFNHLDEENYKEALEVCLDAISIDPYCSYALTLTGSIALKENFKELAFNCFDKAAKYGIIEREYVTNELVKKHIEKSPKRLKAIDLHIWECDLCISSKEINMNKILPIKLNHIQNISNHLVLDREWEKIKESRIYKQFLPFWELNRNSGPSPILCDIPIFAIESFKQEKLPWFETLYLQRAMPVSFREELLFAISPNSHFSHRINTNTSGSEILLNTLDSNHWFLSEKIRKNSKHRQVLYCRLLGALGFYKEALEALPIPSRSSPWSLDDEYAFCTKLFLENIFFARSNNFSYNDLEFAYNKLSNRQESFRMKLLMTILSTVIYGQKREIKLVEEWRDRGFQILEKIINCQMFDTFEKELLISRFYRAMCYYPYLKGDQSTLKLEAQICEKYARNLLPKNERQEILKNENLFPMLESMSRIYQHLGEHSYSLKMMEEIVIKVDPYDAKAWIQFGDLKEKAGFLDEAKDAFQAACNLGAPLGGLAWYRLGRISEKTEDLQWAQYCFHRSLKFCPKGISPHKRLQALSSDGYIHHWCERSLTALKSYSNPLRN